MFTSIGGVFKLSKEGNVGEYLLENIEDNVKGVTIHTYSGENYRLDCDDSVILAVKEVSYDTHEEDIFKNGITQSYSLDNSRNLEDCRMIKLKGICFKVIKLEGLILLNNEIINKVEYKCQEEEFKKLLESVDEAYEVYSKEYFDL